MTDDYAVAAEFYDLWALGHWQQMGPALAEAIGNQVDVSAGPIVELGAGTGLGTLVIADAVPDASIIAAEPSRGMRGVLVSRVAARADLRSRVTVVASAFGGLQWPDRIGGFVAMAMLGHLTPDERERLWQQLGEHLAPGAPAVVHLQPPARPERVPLVRHTVVDLGDHTYEGWTEGEPIGDRVVRWSMRYVVRRGDELLDEQRWTSDFQTVSAGDVSREAGRAGLTISPASPDLLVLRSSQAS